MLLMRTKPSFLNRRRTERLIEPPVGTKKGNGVGVVGVVGVVAANYHCADQQAVARQERVSARSQKQTLPAPSTTSSQKPDDRIRLTLAPINRPRPPPILRAGREIIPISIISLLENLRRGGASLISASHPTIPDAEPGRSKTTRPFPLTTNGLAPVLTLIATSRHPSTLDTAFQLLEDFLDDERRPENAARLVQKGCIHSLVKFLTQRTVGEPLWDEQIERVLALIEIVEPRDLEEVPRIGLADCHAAWLSTLEHEWVQVGVEYLRASCRKGRMQMVCLLSPPRCRPDIDLTPFEETASFAETFLERHGFSPLIRLIDPEMGHPCGIPLTAGLLLVIRECISTEKHRKKFRSSKGLKALVNRLKETADEAISAQILELLSVIMTSRERLSTYKLGVSFRGCLADTGLPSYRADDSVAEFTSLGGIRLILRLLKVGTLAAQSSLSKLIRNVIKFDHNHMEKSTLTLLVNLLTRVKHRYDPLGKFAPAPKPHKDTIELQPVVAPLVEDVVCEVTLTIEEIEALLESPVVSVPVVEIVIKKPETYKTPAPYIGP
ncbi:hypothetical protein BDK51DRAFT_50786 [Blyttiomyces helicus]|uniref:Uncharacterized protein n=1 Tax=Blyttiomyces helicus TaxID=388810 RepID=A0A4P9WAN6_9FUNG|nr:hypothetical protein BDK51DRAFT_50786 [Blyttiomyces helicus]|eukprot:RKO88218.1 hypothetical protein BDK51DRAFT_50786 [Blyttiomyces helicus]